MLECWSVLSYDVCVCENDRGEIEKKAEITSAILNLSVSFSADFMI